MLRYSFLCFIALAGCVQVLAQNVEFSTDVNTNRIGQKDQLQVTYTLRDAQNVQTMGPANLTDFDVVAGPFQSQGSNITVVGNKMVQSVSISLTYVLQPKRTGVLTVPAAIAKDAEGHSWQSNPVQVQVVPGSLAAQQPRRQQRAYDPWGDDPWAAAQQRRMQQYQQAMQAQRQQAMRQRQQEAQQNSQVASADISNDIFIKVSVDKSKLHVGEQVTASYKLYARIPMQVGISKLPSLNGFWTQDFEIPKNIKPVEETYNGKKYQVFLLKKSALFPQQTGTLELDPAEAEGTARVIQTVKQRNPFSDIFDDPAFQQAFGGSLMMNDPFFNDDMFSSYAYRDVPVHIKSAPVKITVDALPEEGKPAGYGGAVGKFSIGAKMDKCTFTTDDVANLRVTITGSGNLKLIEPPVLNLPNGLQNFDPQALDTITGRSTTISGSKIITYPISARTPGDYQIPAISFSYYDPNTKAYVLSSTQPVTIHIKPGKNYSPALAGAGLKDIHNITTSPLGPLSFAGKPLLFTAGYWSMYALPLLAFVGLAFWRRREDEMSKDIVQLKSRKANKIALKRLTTAKALLEQSKQTPFYEEVSKAIWLYLSDKLNIPLSTLSKESAQYALSTRNVPQDLQLRMERVISDCETALYAPMGGSQQMNNTYQEAVGVISRLEETFNS
jgi:hypothetical protein